MQTLSSRKDLLEESYHVYCVWLAESLFCYYICCCNVLSSAGCILLYKDAHMAAHKGLQDPKSVCTAFLQYIHQQCILDGVVSPQIGA